MNDTLITTKDSVIPAKAGIHTNISLGMGPGLRRGDVWKYAFTLIAFALPFIVFCAGSAIAQTFSVNMGNGDDNPGTVSGRAMQLVALITVLSLAPSILMMMTSFVRIIVVLSFLRTAIGLQQTPPNSVMISLALFLTLFIMAPTLEKAYTDGLKPYMSEEIDEVTAFTRTTDPFKQFMLQHARPADLDLFMAAAKYELPKPSAADPVAPAREGAPPNNSAEATVNKSPQNEVIMKTPLQIVIPAFMISELRRAFEIGFMLFLPFLIIDMVTASILMSMGMMMLPPVAISLPFKIIFFVMVDGWHLVAGSLIQSFSTPLGG
jgi:flagellar biosynthesis protein FliP